MIAVTWSITVRTAGVRPTSRWNSSHSSRVSGGNCVGTLTKRDGGLTAAFMNYEAFDRDAAFAGNADTSGLSKIPALAIVCQNPFGNTLQRQLVAAGLKHTKGVSLDGCAHWIFEENPDETLAAITEFLGTANEGR